jgi:hypothetical protein
MTEWTYNIILELYELLTHTHYHRGKLLQIKISNHNQFLTNKCMVVLSPRAMI